MTADRSPSRAVANGRHLHAVPDRDGQPLVGVFWALLFTLAVVGLVALAVAGCTAQPERPVPCVGCVITEGGR